MMKGNIRREEGRKGGEKDRERKEWKGENKRSSSIKRMKRGREKEFIQ